MNELILVAGMAAVTYAIRYPIIALLGKVSISPRFFELLRFVPVAVLTAIIVPALLMPAGVVDIGFDNTRLLTGLLAILIAWRTRNLLLTISIGMLGLWVLPFFLQ
jgi:branched-subunit amino acid transport protein